MSTYTVEVAPDQDAWSLYVPEVDRVTQALHVREVDHMARDLVAIMTGEAPATITLDIKWPAQIGDPVRRWEDAARQLEAAQAARKEAARELRAGGLPYRDVAHLLGVSYQRVQQLTA